MVGLAWYAVKALASKNHSRVRHPAQHLLRNAGSVTSPYGPNHAAVVVKTDWGRVADNPDGIIFTALDRLTPKANGESPLTGSATSMLGTDGGTTYTLASRGGRDTVVATATVRRFPSVGSNSRSWLSSTSLTTTNRLAISATSLRRNASGPPAVSSDQCRHW